MSKSGRPREFKDTAIIDSAMAAFWANGYEACSTEALCKETGLGRGSLYNAFGSKHELYEQALLRYHELGIQEQISILRNDSPVQQRLQALMEWAIKEDFSHEGRRGCLLINAAMERASRDPVVERLFNRHIGMLQKALEQAIADGQDRGEIARDRSSSELAGFYLSSYYGLRVLNAAARNRDMAEQIVKGTLSSIF